MSIKWVFGDMLCLLGLHRMKNVGGATGNRVIKVCTRTGCGYTTDLWGNKLL